jgi:hypothetical protein
VKILAATILILISSVAYSRAFVTLEDGTVIPVIGRLGDTLCIYHETYCRNGFNFKGEFPHREGDDDDNQCLIYPICEDEGGLVASPGPVLVRPCYRVIE